MMEKHARQIIYTGTVILVLLIGFLVYGYKVHTTLTAHSIATDAELTQIQETLRQKEADLAQYGTNLDEIRQAYALSEENGSELLQMLTAEKNKNEAFEEQIDDISGTVGKLDKLSKIDPELLQKYSKVYFLNEHYVPPKLTLIPSEYVYHEDGDPESLHAEAFPFFEDMVTDALEDGVKLWVVSAFRSFNEQRALKSAYTVTYGSGANTFSADQGYSEHQLGTTLDFTTENLGGGLTNFETTAAYTWLQKNAYKYGFVLSYPKDNAYYVFEPWHWRFVGEDLADDLHDNEKSFYDLDQREIDTYLIKLFD